MCLRFAVEDPESVLEKGTFHGHEYVITHNGIGFRCGYVKVEPGHPWFGKDMDEVQAQAHGGITFAEPDVNCDAGGPDDGYWVGFDCMHGGDGADLDLPFDRHEQQSHNEWQQKHEHLLNTLGKRRVWSTEDVRLECWKLALQASVAASSLALAA